MKDIESNNQDLDDWGSYLISYPDEVREVEETTDMVLLWVVAEALSLNKSDLEVSGYYYSLACYNLAAREKEHSGSMSDKLVPTEDNLVRYQELLDIRNAGQLFKSEDTTCVPVSLYKAQLPQRQALEAKWIQNLELIDYYCQVEEYYADLPWEDPGVDEMINIIHAKANRFDVFSQIDEMVDNIDSMYMLGDPESRHILKRLHQMFYRPDGHSSIFNDSQQTLGVLAIIDRLVTLNSSTDGKISAKQLISNEFYQRVFNSIKAVIENHNPEALIETHVKIRDNLIDHRSNIISQLQIESTDLVLQLLKFTSSHDHL